MAKKLFQRKKNTFQVSIGEEGAVVVYTQSGYAQAKIFVKSTEQADTEKLRELLSHDRDAMIYIYIDTLDQSYVQRSLPAVSAMGVNKVAQKRLEKEIPKGHLKACVQIGRAPSGRKDWIYTFISSGIEPPISTWIEFFLPFHNVIAGIYFLPIEIYSVVTKLKALAQKENQFQQKDKRSGLGKFLSFLQPTASTNSGRWEVYLSQNKTGGFRQAAFQDGKIIFSRLLNNINDPSPDVVAGNIEQEVANSIEYMTRLSLGAEQEVDVYLILSSEILRYLRKEKIKATNLFTYSPFELANKIKVPEAASEKDKFIDPTLLTALSKVKSKIMTLHTPITEKVYNATQIINYIGLTFVFLIPVMIVFIIYFANNIFDLKASIVQVKNQALNFQVQVNEQKKKLTQTEGKIKESLKAAHVIELVNLYKFFKSASADPEVVIEKFSQVMPPYARVKVIRWNYDEPVMFGTQSSDKSVKTSIIGKKREYALNIDLEVVMRRTGSTFDELEQKYTSFTKDIMKTFPDFDISISELPQVISFQESNSPVSLAVKLVYPATKKGAISKTPSIPQTQVQTMVPKPQQAAPSPASPNFAPNPQGSGIVNNAPNPQSGGNGPNNSVR
jgi:cell division protein FtsL